MGNYKHGKRKTYLSNKEIREIKMAAPGFYGSKGVEDHIKNKIGFLAEGCTFDFIPFPDDIRAGNTQFGRYDVICRHKDGEVILHYKVNFDSSGRFVPDALVDNTNKLRLSK